MALPEIVINLEKIKHNTQIVKALAEAAGIKVVAVTKGCLGDSRIAQAMLDGGAEMLADSRLENLARLRLALPGIPLMLLRIPGLSQAKDTVRLADVSLNSDLQVIKALAAEALRQGKTHRVILMVDLGDLREGIWPENLPGLLEESLALKGIEIEGIGANLACYGGVVPAKENMGQLELLVEDMEKRFGCTFKVISGGNSANLPLLLAGQEQGRVNQLRIGEGILLGCETVNRQLLPGAFPDAFMLRAEVVECYEKPTMPLGEMGQDAFGNLPQFIDEGWRRRGILALGRQDVPMEGLSPIDSRLKIFGGSSDHLLVDLTDTPELMVGSVVEFNVRYGALLGAMTSPFVQKGYI